MNQPLTVPLFLPRQASDHSQLKRWRTVGPRAPGTLRPRSRQSRLEESRHPSQTVAGPVPAPEAATVVSRDDSAGRDPNGSRTRSRAVWAVVITGLALFMASLDNLVVSTALPVIREHLHAGLSGLEWTVNAYTLTFAVLLLSAAAMGERFGRRRIFVLGIAVFTAASAVAALAPSIGVLVMARAVQGAGGAMIMPLSLTLLSAAVPPERRNVALGIWGAIGGAAVALGPLVGGAVTSGWSWQYIFWLNVPVGVVLIPLAWWKLAESRGARARLDLVGVVAVSVGLLGVVLGLVEGNSHGWTSTLGPLLLRRGDGGPPRVRRLGAALRPSHAGHPPVPRPRLRLGQRDGPAVQLRDVRGHLLPGAVPPDGPGALPAGRRGADPAVDRHAHAVGSGGGPAGRAVGWKAPGGHGSQPAGGRAGLAGHGHVAHHALCRPGGAVRGLRDRHDALLRAPGLSGARGGAPVPGGGGLRSQRRLP